MSAAGTIRDCIKKMNVGEIFTTRDMLKHGSRTAVDNALYKLNKCHAITRVAFGVYIKGNPNTPMPSVHTIARTKSNGFRRMIAPIDVPLAKRLKFPTEAGAKNRLFASTGRSSKIWTVHGFIYFVGTSLRKIALTESKVGSDLRTIWQMGKGKNIDLVTKHVIGWREEFWDEAHSYAKELPQWLFEHTLKLPRRGRTFGLI